MPLLRALQPLLLLKKFLMSGSQGPQGVPCRCLGLCAWEGLVSWRQEPPREPAFWGPEPLEHAGGMLAWPAAELISWRVAECGWHARRGGRLLA